MSDDETTIPFYGPHQQPAPPRQPQHGELLFEYAKEGALSCGTPRLRRVTALRRSTS